MSFLETISAVILLGFWVWTIYYVVVIAFGWPYSRESLVRPFTMESLRNPVDLPSISIIVAAKDEENVIEATLQNIVDLRYPKDLLQIIVAEDGSEDRTRGICETFARARPEVLFLHGNVSSVKAAALNRAVAYARGDILLFLDADTRFDLDLLLRAAKFFHNQPDVHAAQALIEADGDKPTLVARLDQYETAIWYRGVLSGKDRLDLFVPLCGTGMFIRRSALERAGPWDVNSLAEDIDMTVRLAAMGITAKALPANVWRQPPYSVRDFVHQRKRWWGGAAQAFPRAIRAWSSPFLARRKKIDMALQLASPLVVAAGALYLVLAALFSSSGLVLSGLLSATLLGIITSQIVLAGTIVVHSAARRSLRDLDLIPGIYLYWALQIYAVFSVLVALALGLPPRWRVTEKRPVPAARPAPAIREPIPLVFLVKTYLPRILSDNLVLLAPSGTRPEALVGAPHNDFVPAEEDKLVARVFPPGQNAAAVDQGFSHDP